MFFTINAAIKSRRILKIFCEFKKSKKCISKMATDLNSEEYNKAVYKLNALQMVRKNEFGIKPIKDEGCLELMNNLLDRVNITQENLKRLNIVHVAGTKGKGSTCAFVESILRQHGYKTGLYTSPHLIEVRERIKINGKPISKSEFAEYFDEVYSMLEKTRDDYVVEFPSYFYFLTVMAFHVFLSKRVDVAIIEVGIGGSFDCTNVINYPTVCGITALGMDHTNVLGNALPSIAWHKAGIFKPNVPAFTSRQPLEAMEIIYSRAIERQTNVLIAPDFSQYKSAKKQIKLGLSGDHQYINASLALQLAQTCMETMEKTKKIATTETVATPFKLTQNHIRGLERCKWDGRCQVIKFNRVTFYLDAAHTVRSMQCCAEWFQRASQQEEKDLSVPCTKVLAFNVTKQRNSNSMFYELLDCELSHAIFVPNVATLVDSTTADQTNLLHPMEDQILQVVKNRNIWVELNQKKLMAVATGHRMLSGGEDIGLNLPSFREDIISRTYAFSSIANAVSWLGNERDSKLVALASHLVTPETSNGKNISKKEHLQVLVTGSVHLVGGFLRVIYPTLNNGEIL